MSKYFLSTVLIIILFCQVSFAQVVMRDTSWAWRHYAYQLNQNGTLASWSTDPNDITETVFHGKVIENEYIRIVLLPEFGGRIISYVYKPTGHEELYQNPIGVPYDIGSKFFYYDWLMVYGGIFPTFPEPEHGKTWFLPWQERVLENTSDRITVQMSFRDNINAPHPPNFWKGVTDISCNFIVSVNRGCSDIEITVELINNQDRDVRYEYWTDGTLAPGSTPGNTVCTDQAEMILSQKHVRLKDDWWAWMGTAENVVNSNEHIFEWNNLAYYKNWDGWGIVYANPKLEEDYYGLINHENEEGIFKVGENQTQTVGLKIYTFGYEQSRDADLLKFEDLERPFIEMWSGTSSEFFIDAILRPREFKTWTTHYLPTVGLDKVVEVTKEGALDMVYNQNDGFQARFFSTKPEKEYSIKLKLVDNWDHQLAETTFESDPATFFEITIPRANVDIDAGQYHFIATIYDQSGNEVIQGSIPVDIERNPNALDAYFTASQNRVNINQEVQFADASTGTISSYEWDFGVGASPATANGKGAHTVSYSSYGEKIVKLRVHGSLGTDTYFQKFQVQPENNCLAKFNTDFSSARDLDFFEFIPSSSGIYTKELHDGVVTIHAQGQPDEYEDYFQLNVNDGNSKKTIDVSNGSERVFLRVKASSAMSLRVSLRDEFGNEALNGELSGNLGVYEPLSFDLPVNTNWQTFELNFANKLFDDWRNPGSVVDATKIDAITFRPNQGYASQPVLGFDTPFNGSLDIDFVLVGNGNEQCFDTYDCEGTLKGSAIVDACGRCTEGNTGISSSTSPLDCQIVGINEDEFTDMAFQVYPNPSQGNFYVNAKIDHPVQLQLTNSRGTVVYEKELNPQSGEINTHIDNAALESGIYTLKLINGSHPLSHKIIVY